MLRHEVLYIFDYLCGSGAYVVSYPMGTAGCFRREKWKGGEVDHSFPSSAEIKNVGAIILLSLGSSWHSA